MKDKKLLILLILITCTILSFLAEVLVLNHKVLLKNNKYEPEVVEMKGIIKDKNWYKTTTNKAYIILKTKNNDNYINKLKFDYHINKDIDWQVEYTPSNSKSDKKIIANKSSSLINKATKKIKDNTSEIKISIPHRNVRFKNIEFNNRIYINLSRIFFMTIVLFSLIILTLKRNYFIKNIEKAFLFIAIICGGLYILILPKNAYISWDDTIHLKTSYTLLSKDKSKFSNAFKLVESNGKINNGVFQTREEVLELHKSLNKIHKETKNDTIQINRSRQKYNKIVYLPFSLGFKISSILGLNFIFSIIIAKLFNFLTYIFLIYSAIKISDKLKKLVFLIGLIPTNIFLASQFSYDPTIIAATILGIAAFIKMLEMPKVNYKYILVFVLSIVWASLPKAIYCPILLLIWLIPNNKFINKKEAISVKISVTTIMLLLMSTFVLPMLLGGVGGDARGGNTNASEQLKLIMNNPIGYAILIIKFVCQNGASLVLGESTFAYICYLQYYISMFSPIIYMVYLIFTLYILYTTEFDKKIITWKVKTALAIIYIMVSGLIITALYLSFTEVGANTIEGVQPRYFVPMLLMLLVIISSTTRQKTKSDDKARNNNILLLLVPFISLILTILPIIMVGRGI